jgi:hypothetical protein
LKKGLGKFIALIHPYANVKKQAHFLQGTPVSDNRLSVGFLCSWRDARPGGKPAL